MEVHLCCGLLLAYVHVSESCKSHWDRELNFRHQNFGDAKANPNVCNSTGDTV